RPDQAAAATSSRRASSCWPILTQCRCDAGRQSMDGRQQWLSCEGRRQPTESGTFGVGESARGAHDLVLQFLISVGLGYCCAVGNGLAKLARKATLLHEVHAVLFGPRPGRWSGAISASSWPSRAGRPHGCLPEIGEGRFDSGGSFRNNGATWDQLLLCPPRRRMNVAQSGSPAEVQCPALWPPST